MVRATLQLVSLNDNFTYKYFFILQQGTLLLSSSSWELILLLINRS